MSFVSLQSVVKEVFLEKIAIHKLEKLQWRKTFKSSQNNSFKVEINDKYFESKEQPFTLD